MRIYDDSPVNGYLSCSGFPENDYDEPDEDNPHYRTEFDERVTALAAFDIKERLLEPEENRIRRLDEKLKRLGMI